MDSKWYSPALARPLVWTNPYNRFIAFLSLGAYPIALLICYFLFYQPLLTALWTAAGAPVTVFLAWAIGREADPARPWSAILGAMLSLLGWMFWTNPDFLLLAALLFSLRIINRSTGHKSSILESVAVLGLSVWLAFDGAVFTAGIIGLIFLLDARLPDRWPLHQAFALLTIGTATAAAFTTAEVILYPDETHLYFVGVVILLTIPTVIYYLSREVLADNGMGIAQSRLVAATVIPGLMLAASGLTSRSLSLPALYPVLAMLTGVAILNTASILRPGN